LVRAKGFAKLRLPGEATENRSSRLPSAVYRLARRVDNASLGLLDAGMVAAAWTVAYFAGYSGRVPSEIVSAPWIYLGVPVVVQLLVNRGARLYGPVWRYASVEEAGRVVIAVVAGTLLSTVAVASAAEVGNTDFPTLTAPPVAALVALAGLGGMRFQARLFARERLQTRGRKGASPTLIVGAGHAGAALARELQADGRDGLHLVGFVDDDPDLRGRWVRGVRVLGTTEDLDALCRRLDIERVLIAMPHTGRDRIQTIVKMALRTNAQVKVLRPTSELISGPLVRSLRDIDVTDLLGREHTPVDSTEIGEYLRGATVLVTGAGGSIGSEIARQVSLYEPRKLLLLDRDESLLHDMLLELPDAEPVLADIRDGASIRGIFQRHRPDVVFHAAAHKHVPMLERHAIEAVRTNVLATAQLAVIAAEQGCGRFVHISTDKAAKPCSVMGASKRAAELVVFDVGRRYGLPFAAVRFGNVLGSRGSVVPTFLRQILDGGPITVTSRDMTRYFMTSTEAVSLVLQAGAMADHGTVFLLDMGEPVAILDLARQMIRLAGLRPDEDIPIEIVGARAGERLHEQLHDDAETVDPTSHPAIQAVKSAVDRDEESLAFFIDLLAQKCDDGDDVLVASLLEQLLRRNGIECTLSIARPREVSILDAERLHDALDGAPTTTQRRERTAKRPALLGGEPAFTAGVPFARPARPPIETVVRRYAPSYERGILTNGPLVAELEERAANRVQARQVVAVSSCTAGLMLALQAAVDGRPGPVVLPSFTFSASGLAVLWNSRGVRFVDCDPTTFQVDVAHVAEVLDGASAILATHVYGAPCDPALAERVANSHGVPLVFDAAHAFGAVAGQRPVGSYGLAEVFSLTPTKVLVAGEGGLVATNDSGLADRLRIARDYANPGDYDSRFAGLNARMSEFHAATALSSLEILDRTLGRRRDIAMRYSKLLADIPGVRLQSVRSSDESTYKDFTIAIDPDDFGLTRAQLAYALRTEGVDTRTYFSPPLHLQHAFRDLDSPELPVTERVSSRVLSLPIYPDLDDITVERIAEIVHTAHLHALELDAHLASERFGVVEGALELG
jgi:FlaA1/EpsC-like NDP-sugar epimerase/dTDP-4-amino-4,6-dideoxygalactose transaminase